MKLRCGVSVTNLRAGSARKSSSMKMSVTRAREHAVALHPIAFGQPGSVRSLCVKLGGNLREHPLYRDNSHSGCRLMPDTGVARGFDDGFTRTGQGAGVTSARL